MVCLMIGLFAGIGYTIISVLDSFGDKPKPEPEPNRFMFLRLQNSLYVIDKVGQTVLDTGRGLVFGFGEGLKTEPNVDVLTWEGKRRVLASSPTVNMTLVQQALGVDNGPALPMPQQGQGGGWLKWEDEDNE